MSANLSSSEDETPEEVTFQSAASETLKHQRERRHLEIEANRIAKERHRARDTRLKSQTTNRRKLLSEILSQEEQLSLQAKNADEVTLRGREEEKPVLKLKPKSRKFSVEGINVEVNKKINRKLPPPPSSSIKKTRERFLQRGSIKRR